MQYNTCKTCGADGGRAGNLTTSQSIGSFEECDNCHDTRKTGTLVIHAGLNRTKEEFGKTADILNTTIWQNQTVKAVISYKIDVDVKEGTIYNQRIRIPRLIYTRLKNAVEIEINNKYPNKQEYVNTPGYETYLKPLEDNNGVCFLNHTQRKFINRFLGLKLDYKHNSYFKIDK